MWWLLIWWWVQSVTLVNLKCDLKLTSYTNRTNLTAPATNLKKRFNNCHRWSTRCVPSYLNGLYWIFGEIPWQINQLALDYVTGESVRSCYAPLRSFYSTGKFITGHILFDRVDSAIVKLSTKYHGEKDCGWDLFSCLNGTFLFLLPVRNLVQPQYQ